jgi:hypothetical protein
LDKREESKVGRIFLAFLIVGSLLLTLHFGVSAWRSSVDDSGIEVVGSLRQP